jgi:hypothetical protein
MQVIFPWINLATLEEIDGAEKFKSFLCTSFKEMINELVEQEHQIITNYKNNPTFPFDYYSLLLREINTKIGCKREVYKRLTGEELK